MLWPTFCSAFHCLAGFRSGHILQSPRALLISSTNWRSVKDRPMRDPQASAAAADGMQLLARLMEQIGYDRQQAWLVFSQSPEGQRIMRVPGALSLLTDWFNATMALSSGPHPPANSGARRQEQHPTSRSSGRRSRWHTYTAIPWTISTQRLWPWYK